MLIKTCQAENLSELVNKVRSTYGSQAVLLSVRRIEPTEASNTGSLVEGTIACNVQNLPACTAAEHAAEVKISAPKIRTAKEFLAPQYDPIPSYYRESTTPAAQRPGLTTTTYVANTKRHIFKGRAVALVGPMGAGKTTTTAKIAGRLQKTQSQPVGVVSTDTDRPGGSALLAAYAGELRLFSTTSSSASDLRNRISRWNNRGPIVIDTRGYSSRDSLAIERLGEMLDGTGIEIEKYLVLSATEHPAIAKESLISYGAMGIKGVILTRIDQAAGIGQCLEEVRKCNMEIAFLGTGERVPEDLREPSTTNLLTLETARRAAL
jgi:flagellar biosynthesis GTPase FlhF